MNEIIQQYRQLRDEVDRKVTELETIHSDHIVCQKGCCGCCMNLSVWPVEFNSIVGEMKQFEWLVPSFNGAADCGFLKDGKCAIYPFRPLICRTHGLPLVYWNDEADSPGYGVMFCEKNFMLADEIDFNSDNTLNMDQVNEKLARINLAFIGEKKDASLEPTARIEMQKISDYL